MQRIVLIFSAFFSVSLLSHTLVPAQAAGSASIIQPDALTWAPAKGVPPGAQVAVLYGNPSKKGPLFLTEDAMSPICHLADKRTRPPNGRYWVHSGH